MPLILKEMQCCIYNKMKYSNVTIDSEGIAMMLLVSITTLKSIIESTSRPNPATDGALHSTSCKHCSIFIDSP